jgi:glutamate-1-semialdehyde 2,1-aminomutase
VTTTEHTTVAAQIRAEDVHRVVEQESARFLERQPRSTAMIERARQVLAGGATSSWQIADPQAVWLTHGQGSKFYDVDGTEYSDFHGGYGVSIAGHAHPAIVRAVQDRVARGTHFAQPTEDAIDVAEELRRRWQLPLWRFANSGTEATMDVVHLMRAAKGRDLVLKVEGCYHGHHDAVQVSIAPEADAIGPADRPVPYFENTGIPNAIQELVVVVAYNDLAMVERALREHEGRIAGMILEPIMMNAGIILPDDGYLADLKDLLHRHDALLAFDEVKTGFTAGPAGASGRYGVVPDLVAVAKALGGGVSTAAIGGTEEVMGLITEGRYDQVGTFNGNPLSMAAAKACLTEVLTPEAYEHLERLEGRMREGIEQVIRSHDLPWHVVTVGAKGSVVFREQPCRNYRDYLEIDALLGQAHWLVQHNGGVFLPPWGKSEQWLLSVQHTDEDVDRFVANVERLASLLVRED